MSAEAVGEGGGAWLARVGPADALLEEPDGDGARPHHRSLRVDALGRWLSARLEDGLHRRTVDGRVVRYEARTRPPVDVPEPGAVHARVQALAEEFHAALTGGAAAQIQTRGEFAAPPREHLEGLVGAATRWGRAAFERELARYEAVYDENVEILPPDRTLDVVVLPAAGCPNASCTFCAFYRGRGLRVKPSAELVAHLEGVRDLFGPALALRRGVFLGSASAISLSQAKLERALEETQRILGRSFPAGAAAFWDPDHAPTRSGEDWVRLRQRGLRQVYVGLETGSPALRAEAGKSGDLEAFGASLHPTREAGVRLGVIVLVGLGGVARAQEHLRETTRAVERLGLQAQDTVFLSAWEGSMPPAALRASERALRDALRAVTAAKVVPYAMRSFRYYA